MLVWFDKIDGFIRAYDGTKYYLVLLGAEKYDFIYKRIRYLIGMKNVLYIYYYTLPVFDDRYKELK